jgi:HK97 family phage major capsid protein
MILALEENNVPFSNPGWIFSPRIAMFLMTLRDGLGNYVFRAEMQTGKFWGYPFRKTTQIPTNLGSGSDSEFYLADFDDVIIGDTMNIQVAVSEEASYRNENDELVSAFSLDQTVMRVLLEHDIVLRHDESVAVMTECPWTPGGAS